MNTTATTTDIGNTNDQEYNDYLVRVRERFLSNTEQGTVPVFTTDAENLWATYLTSFSESERQHHNCHACRHFIERFGGLVVIDDDGKPRSAVWCESDAPLEYIPTVRAMTNILRKAKITGVFLSSQEVYGTPVTGVWRHLHTTPAKASVFRPGVLTAEQKMAEKKEDYKNVKLALSEYSASTLDLALRLLRADALYRSEKILGQAEWLHSLHAHKTRPNLIWRAVATAPAGFCHPRSGMLGTLLDDLAAGKDFETVAGAFRAKMHPLAYQRPQAAPSAATVAAAEKIVAQLGAAGSLARRFARMEDIVTIWKPAPTKDAPASGGVFGKVRTKDAEPESKIRVPSITMTLSKFQRTVLPSAERIEILTPARGSYTALVTAVNYDAPPILQWDRPEARNPVSWYFWNGGAPAHQFGLVAGVYCPVKALAQKPSMWGGGSPHHGDGLLFVIDGARESKVSGSALFPEMLRSEFHGVRSVIEAFSREATIEGANEPHVAGYMVDSKSPFTVSLRVYSGAVSQDYKLDRWD